MDKPERPGDEAIQLVRWLSNEAQRIARKTRKQRLLERVAKAALLIVLATVVIVPGMIATGFLFGPRGIEGLLAAPLVLFSTWAAILYWFFGRKPSVRSVKRAEIAALPAQTEAWLEQERRRLPKTTQAELEQLTLRLEALTPQVALLDPGAPVAHELRRLLAEELPELVRGYRKVPEALARQPLYGGKTPEEQLREGLETIDVQLGRVHERLAADDLHALATHQRYLELKYKRDDDEVE